MKLFIEQISECEKKGFPRLGKFISFEHHPEMMPFRPSPSHIKGFNEIICGRFGGSCHAKHKGCLKLRGCEETSP